MYILRPEDIKIMFIFIPYYNRYFLLQAIARIMADKVYTSAEFKRERDNFHVSIMIHIVPDLGFFLRILLPSIGGFFILIFYVIYHIQSSSTHI